MFTLFCYGNNRTYIIILLTFRHVSSYTSYFPCSFTSIYYYTSLCLSHNNTSISSHFIAHITQTLFSYYITFFRADSCSSSILIHIHYIYIYMYIHLSHLSSYQNVLFVVYIFIYNLHPYSFYS